RGAGAAFSFVIAPPPNTTYYLNVSGDNTSVGAYAIQVKPLKKFDSFEPDDDIYSVHALTLGQTIDANIMDADDSDYYSFESPRSGVVSIDIENRSGVLIPALTTFTPDRRTSGFGPDLQTPGASLHHTMAVQEGQTYFIQVWSQAKTAGEY